MLEYLDLSQLHLLDPTAPVYFYNQVEGSWRLQGNLLLLGYNVIAVRCQGFMPLALRSQCFPASNTLSVPHEDLCLLTSDRREYRMVDCGDNKPYQWEVMSGPLQQEAYLVKAWHFGLPTQTLGSL
jgi:hypothetical protein